MPKILITLTVLFLTLSAVFGVLNTNKTRALRDLAARNETARSEAERARTRAEKQLQARQADKPNEPPRPSDAEAKIATAEADLVNAQSEKAELQAQLRANQEQIAQLQHRLDDVASAPKEAAPDLLPMPGAGDLQAQLEDTRKQVDSADRERQLHGQSPREVTAGGGGATEPPQKRRANLKPDLRGTVLAVNQAYNFVVLNVGGRHGIEANSEMLVLRGGTLIGRIRVSSVEPATAIGDIVSSSLARGVQVQPGDTVIYAGTNS
jgi:hypothetical protein